MILRLYFFLVTWTRSSPPPFCEICDRKMFFLLKASLSHTQRFEFFDSRVSSITLLTVFLLCGLYPVSPLPDLRGLCPQVIRVNIVLRVRSQLVPALLEAISFVLKELPSYFPEDQSPWFGAVSSRNSYCMLFLN